MHLNLSSPLDSGFRWHNFNHITVPVTRNPIIQDFLVDWTEERADLRFKGKSWMYQSEQASFWGSLTRVFVCSWILPLLEKQSKEGRRGSGRGLGSSPPPPSPPPPQCNVHGLFLIYPTTSPQLTLYGSWYSLRVCFTRNFWGQKIALSPATKDAGYAGSTGPQTPVIKLVASGRSCMTPWLWNF